MDIGEDGITSSGRWQNIVNSYASNGISCGDYHMPICVPYMDDWLIAQVLLARKMARWGLKHPWYGKIRIYEKFLDRNS